MKAQHTPGPWHVYYGGNFTKVAPSEYDDMVKKTNYLGGAICCMDDWDGTSHTSDAGRLNAEANAEFIVRACNAHYLLVAALEGILLWDDGNLPGDVMDAARVALAKAKGDV